MADVSALNQLLGACSTLSLATVGEDGLAHAANVNFMADEQLRLYWLSKPNSAHSEHLQREPRVAATAYAPFEEPGEIRGVQLHGRAEMAAEGEFDRLWEMFCGKFPYAVGMTERALQESFYVLTPTWARLIDNTVRFGFKQEWDLRGGA